MIRWARANKPQAAAVALLVVLQLFYQSLHPHGFTRDVLVQNANELAALGLAGMAQTLPVLLGGIDLSVGAVLTMIACLASHILDGGPATLPAGLLACVAAGAAAGLLNGMVIVLGRLQPIIATLATGAVYLGIALWLRPTPGGHVNEDLTWAMTNDLAEALTTAGLAREGAPWLAPLSAVPVPLLVLLAVVLLLWLPFRASVTGRTVYAIGSAESAAFVSGLPLVRARLAAFTLAGLLAGLGGLMLAIQTGSGNADIPQAGAYTLNSIAAVAVGGTSLLGGRGGAVGSLLGAAILRTIGFIFRVVNIEPLLQPLLEGLVLLAAVSLGALPLLRVRNRLERFR